MDLIYKIGLIITGVLILRVHFFFSLRPCSLTHFSHMPLHPISVHNLMKIVGMFNPFASYPIKLRHVKFIDCICKPSQYIKFDNFVTTPSAEEHQIGHRTFSIMFVQIRKLRRTKTLVYVKFKQIFISLLSSFRFVFLHFVNQPFEAHGSKYPNCFSTIQLAEILLKFPTFFPKCTWFTLFVV